jgi:hypothetical protein
MSAIFVADLESFELCLGCVSAKVNPEVKKRPIANIARILNASTFVRLSEGLPHAVLDRATN